MAKNIEVNYKAFFIKLFSSPPMKYISILHDCKAELKHKKGCQNRDCILKCIQICLSNYYETSNQREHFPNVTDIL